MLQSPDRKPRSRATSLLNQTITKSELSENLQSYLDPLGEVGVEVVAVHDAVLNRVRAIDGELEGGLLASDLAKTLAASFKDAVPRGALRAKLPERRPAGAVSFST